jgi:hypothetical protein
LHPLNNESQITEVRPPKNNCLFIIPARTEFSARTNLFFIFLFFKKASEGRKHRFSGYPDACD